MKKIDLSQISNESDIYKIYNITKEEQDIIKLTLGNKTKDNSSIKTSNYEKIKHKRKNYYLLDNKIYNINKNKTIGELYGNYLNGKVIENNDLEIKNKNI